jgi:Phytanoyl-CoA dioxygenase (PhyH)
MKPGAMSHHTSHIPTAAALPADAAAALDHDGFVVVPGPLDSQGIETLSAAYDLAVATASLADIHAGRTSTLVTDFVNRGAAFDPLYVYSPLLAAAARVIGGPFRLSSFHARTLRPAAQGQGLHVDVARTSADWPLLSFIVMVDPFRPDNGATGFLPGSHRWEAPPDQDDLARQAEPSSTVLATGPAGSFLVFNGSVWHGHTTNHSPYPRRSLQGAFIPQGGRAATDFAGRMQSETRARLSPVARQVLGLERQVAV